MRARHMPTPAKLPLTAAVHVPFSFLRASLKADQDAQFVATTMDIARGIGLCLEMASNSDLVRTMNADADAGDEELPLLDPASTDFLMRFATSAAKLLAEHAEGRIKWLNEYRAKEEK